MDFPLFVASFIFGLASSLHCIGMCGPLALAIPLNDDNQKWINLTAFYVSKAVAYGFIGAILGTFGLGMYLLDGQQAVSIIVGLVLIAFATIPYLHKWLPKFKFQKQYSHIFQQLLLKPKLYHYISLGFLNGWLPCGMVVAALSTAIISGHPLDGFIAMFLFGLGTVPALFPIAYFKTKINLKWRSQFKKITFTFSILIGIVLILRGMNLGIPYISPQFQNDISATPKCH